MNSTLDSSPAPGLTISPTMDLVTWIYFSVTFLAMATCVGGMAGNSLVIWLLSCNGMQRSPFCVYVLNLAVADFLFLFCMASMLSLETGPLLIVNISAKIYEGMRRIKYFAYTAGLSLLTAISTQRCLSVLFPIWYKCHRPRHLSSVVSGALWALAFLMNFLASFFCVQFWHPNKHQCFKVDIVFNSLILGIFMPVMILTSTILFIRVRKNSLMQRRRPRRLYVVILTSILVFLTCSLPLGINWFLLYWVDVKRDVRLLYSCVSRFSSSLSSSANPVIYFLVGSQKSHRLQESLGAVLGRALRDEPEPEGRETPSTCTNDGVEGRGSLLTCGDVEENPGPPKKKRKVSNLLTVHQNLPALPVDATSDEVRKNLMDMFRDRQAFSEHTWKMLLSVCRSWAAWCKLNNRKWFPAEPEDVRDYLLYLQARGLAVKTIQQHLGQLNMLHRRSGLPRPSDSNAVSLVMRRIRKENVDAGERAKQALAFERTDFDQVRSLMENSDRCQDIRNLAFLGIAYNTLLRIAEIARIRVKDISRTDGGRMLIHIGRTKTLVSTAGVEKALSLGVTKLVERWISVSGVADDPNNYLFCRVRKNGVAAPSATSQLSTRALEGIFEATHRLIYGAKDDSGQRYLAWSGHSARVGAARDMARAGVSIPEIMQAGGWTNVNIVMNYIRNLDSETGAMVRLLEDGD